MPLLSGDAFCPLAGEATAAHALANGVGGGVIRGGVVVGCVVVGEATQQGW